MTYIPNRCRRPSVDNDAAPDATSYSINHFSDNPRRIFTTCASSTASCARPYPAAHDGASDRATNAFTTAAVITGRSRR